ncbi:MAG: CoA pyrophosphatase [Gammaproteobacteria bacterium]|nr:CoA pyrophosphatase [Gammaproteobacteria bacterium]
MRTLIERRLTEFRPAADPLARTLANVEGEAPADLRERLQVAAPAAVLLGLVERAHGFCVLLTQRSAHLSVHAGQISFPGGRLETQDSGPVDAALREAAEEIGLEPSLVEVAGRLDDHLVPTGFLISPVVGFIDSDFEPQMDTREVEDVFEVPLEFLLDQSNVGVSYRERMGATFRMYEYRYEDRHIWGATAAILMNFREIIS